MDSRSPHRDFHIDFPLRQIEAATRRFALEAPSTNVNLLCAVLLGPQAAAKASLARRIHNASRRAARPFVRIDCRHSAGVQFAVLNGTMRSTRPIAGDDEPPRHFFRFAAGGTLFFDHWDPVTECECRWTDCGDDECLMVPVPLPQLKEYVAYLSKAAEADLLAAN